MAESATPKASAVPKVYKAIAAIQAGVGNVPKNGVGPSSQGSYKYVKNDDILEAINKLMVEHGVITRPTIVQRELISREIGANRVVPMTVVDLQIEYIAIADGSSFTVQVSAEGADNGDKGMRKAVTQAQKIANLLTFNIATGEPDPDGIEVVPTAQQASPVQQKVAKAQESKTHLEIKKFLGENGMSGSVANALGDRLSGGLPPAEWAKDEKVLQDILKALKAGEVE